MDEKKFKRIARELKYAALARCRAFLFAKVEQATTENAEVAEKGSTNNLTLFELGRGIECYPNDFSQFDLDNLTQKRLVDQLSSVLDSIAISVLKSTHLKAVPIYFPWYNKNHKMLPNRQHSEILLDVDGIPSTIATANVNVNLCQVIIDYLRKVHVSYFANDRYYFGLGSSKLIESLESESGSIPQEYLGKGDVLYQGETCLTNRIRWIRILHVNHLSNHLGVGGILGEGIVFGENGIVVREVKPVELRIIDDKLAVWCGVIACGLAPNATVIHITSAEEVTHD